MFVSLLLCVTTAPDKCRVDVLPQKSRQCFDGPWVFAVQGVVHVERSDCCARDQVVSHGVVSVFVSRLVIQARSTPRFQKYFSLPLALVTCVGLGNAPWRAHARIVCGFTPAMSAKSLEVRLK